MTDHEGIELREKEEREDADEPDGRILREYGDPTKFDPKFNGPTKSRHCTDVLCCLLFIIFITGMVAVASIGFIRGKPSRLVYPTDSTGGTCGVGDLKDKPYLFFFDIATCAKLGAAVVTGCPTQQVCVKKCPKTTESYFTMEKTDLICKYRVDFTKEPYKSMTKQDLVTKEECASYYIESLPVLKRCVPTIFAKVGDLTKELTDKSKEAIKRANNKTVNGEEVKDGLSVVTKLLRLKDTAQFFFEDVVASWHLIVGCLVLAMVFSMVWIILLRWITIPLIWISIILFIGLFGFSTGYSYIKWNEIKSANVTEVIGVPVEFKFSLKYYAELETTWLVFLIASAVILLIFLLVVIFLCSRVNLAGKLIQETSVSIGYMWSVLFWPLVPFAMQVVWLVFWIASLVHIVSMGEPEYYKEPTGGYTVESTSPAPATSSPVSVLNRIPCNPQRNDTLGDICSFVKYGGDKYAKYMMWYMVFMFFWIMNFITALTQMTLAGAFASYYWAWDKSRDIPVAPLASSFWRCLRYHLGSLAFGSVIIAIVQLIRAILEYIARKLKGSENKVAIYCLKCLRCCFWCLEKFLRFVNKNAYILIAIHGRSFCTASKDGFLLVMRNCVRTAVLDQVCSFILFISKLVITAAMGVLAFFLFQNNVPIIEEYYDTADLTYFMAPVVIVVIGSFLITTVFLDVYDSGVDTIYLCFLEDLERNDGSDERPYYMSKSKNLWGLVYKKKNVS